MQLHVDLLFRAVEALTEQSLDLSAPLVPDGRHWSLPYPDWVQQQNAAKPQAQGSTWLQSIMDALTYLTSSRESQQGQIAAVFAAQGSPDLSHNCLALLTDTVYSAF